jgi:hypothetical protein
MPAPAATASAPTAGSGDPQPADAKATDPETVGATPPAGAEQVAEVRGAAVGRVGLAEMAATAPATAESVTAGTTKSFIATTETVTAASLATATVSAPRPTLIGTITAVIFGVFTALERLLTGPPTVPAGSNVTVRTSSLVVGGIRVAADWYYPASDEPPQRIIFLVHGFLAIGPMYSTLAATLAEQTDSIVVVPTFSSNPLADGGMWVNGAGMANAVAQLFVGDRSALNASALAAGLAQQYGLNPADAVLPTEFVLAGHSAGGALVSVVSGLLVDNGAVADLAGVLLLDAVTSGGQLSTALTKLDAYQKQTGRYVPVREIGSPRNAWNFISNVNAALSSARPDQFNGVVLSGGVHTDSMGGGSAISQFLVHLLAGFPTAQNSPALRELAVSWVNDWFEGITDDGDDLVPGSKITIATPNGNATGTVIGTPVTVSSAARDAELAA